MAAAGLVTYGIWSLQLLVFGLVLHFYFHLILYFTIIPIFFMFFLIFFKKIYKPKAAKIVKVEIKKKG